MNLGSEVEEEAEDTKTLQRSSARTKRQGHRSGIHWAVVYRRERGSLYAVGCLDDMQRRSRGCRREVSGGCLISTIFTRRLIKAWRRGGRVPPEDISCRSRPRLLLGPLPAEDGERPRRMRVISSVSGEGERREEGRDGINSRRLQRRGVSFTAQREIRECCVLTFTETWLTEDIPDSAIQLETFAAYRGDRTLASGKHRGGGVCVYVNKRWCTDVQTMEKHCSQDIELLMVKCRPFYLPREFSAVYLTAVYIPPRANTANALGLLHDIIDKHETKHPDAVFIISGDFNHCNLRTVLPKYYQYVSFTTFVCICHGHR
ncbi:uncharacterized protein LOC129187667 [Dunckerocampus dactyliophorus]|uniref:uncharacterized protein LOC129187667 n=1 Tax=Dunckerocampus dactyliophorus TaxID=161453 RepID=UPI00240591E5|nr:uncharacterized protein LOC129187667 [Dunckerocampus dactyliophorus]XP_054643227.1 uncharacterized protein LOC129187667 [Dunckerocampus dactyliophorus]XP_054643228.1 uncharacterized protein LOC129187667 [Dunckerocampus dactyliophorus]